ncbi:MAG: CapA family protein [Candidatus Promineifilaceae bacterium]|nr:CapA family protein [Candidatus Promineifilaceae bacterium]
MSEGEPAELRITQTKSPLLAGNVPLVVAVPFVAEWEETSLEAARAIQSDGHDFAQILAWPQLTPELKALRIDGRLPYEPDYPLIQPYYIEATTGFEGAGQTLAKALLATEEESEPVLLAAVGDLMLDRALGAAIMRGRPEFPFELVSPELTVPDITVGNLESALGDLGSGADKRYTFQAPPRAAYSLAAAGFDVLSLANNHAMDFGPEALLQGIRLLREQGIHAVGAGATSAAARTPAIVQANGLRLAFLAYVNVPVERSGFDTASWQATVDTPGLAWGDPETIAVDVGAARSQADLVIVLLHSGYEYIEEPSEAQRAAAHAAIDAGAHLVLGHHAHLLQGVEFRKQGVIAYGLGNFAFEIEGDPASAILRVWLDGRGVRHLELVPAIVQFGGQPRLAESWEAAPIRRQVYFLTRLLNAR